MSHEHARGYRFGQLMVGLETAIDVLRNAKRAEDLLDPSDRALLDAARETLIGIEQRQWRETLNASPCKPESRRRLRSQRRPQSSPTAGSATKAKPARRR